MTDSSTADNSDVTTTTAATSDANPATSGSSTEATTGEKGPSSVLDAVTAALKPKLDGEASPTSREQGSTLSTTAKPVQAGDDALLPEEISKEELDAQKPQTKRRMEQLLGRIKDQGSQLASASERAQKFDSVMSFVERNGISPEDWKSGLEVMALMKRDPVAAWERLAPIAEQLRSHIGDVLPPDLKRRVDLGYISEPDARALHQAQRREAITRETVQADEQRNAEQREHQQLQTVVRDVTQAVVDWETLKKGSDPDWHLKEPRINQLVRLEVYEKGYPSTKAAAIKMTSDIYDAVTKELRSLAPKPQAVRSAHGAGSSIPTAAQPKSLLEAIQLGLRKTA